jgi:hypothetical protein
MTREKLSRYLKIISNVTTIIIHIYYYSNLKIICSNHKRSNNHNYLFQLSKQTINIKQHNKICLINTITIIQFYESTPSGT